MQEPDGIAARCEVCGRCLRRLRAVIKATSKEAVGDE